MGRVSILGLIDLFLRVNGKTTRLMVLGRTHIKMEGGIKEIGKFVIYLGRII